MSNIETQNEYQVENQNGNQLETQNETQLGIQKGEGIQNACPLDFLINIALNTNSNNSKVKQHVIKPQIKKKQKRPRCTALSEKGCRCKNNEFLSGLCASHYQSHHPRFTIRFV
jgi:hypothetical protein